MVKSFTFAFAFELQTYKQDRIEFFEKIYINRQVSTRVLLFIH